MTLGDGGPRTPKNLFWGFRLTAENVPAAKALPFSSTVGFVHKSDHKLPPRALANGLDSFDLLVRRSQQDFHNAAVLQAEAVRLSSYVRHVLQVSAQTA